MVTRFRLVGPSLPSVRLASEPAKAGYRENRGAWALRLAWEAGQRVSSMILELLQGLDLSQPAALLDFESRLYPLLARFGGDPVVAAVIDAAHEDPEVCARVLTLAATSPAGLQRSSQPVRATLFGGSEVEVATPYFLKRRPRKKTNKGGGGVQARPGVKARGKAGNGFYPILNDLGILNRVSPILASEISRMVASGTMEDAQAILATRGLHLNIKVVRRVALSVAERALSFRSWCVEQEQALRSVDGVARGKRLAILADGGRLRIRAERRRGRPRKSGHRGFDAEWREPKLFVIYELDERGRKKRGGLLRYDGTVGDADRLFELLAAELIRMGADKAAEWVFLADGGAWIWNRVQQLAAEVGIAPDRVTEVLDFYHASQRVQELAEALGGTPAEIQANQAQARRLLRFGNVKALQEMLGPDDYLANHAERVRYVRLRRARLPIGSGAVESCIRRVINLRMKGCGLYWSQSTAEGLIHLRCQLLSGRWSNFIRTTLAPEHNPVLLGRAAGMP